MYYIRLVGDIDAHYTSFETLDPPSFIYVVTARMDEWNQPESWKRITCIMMIHTGHQNKKITVAAQCSLNTVKQSGMNWRIVMENMRLWLEESYIADDLIVMETTRLEESNIADDLIVMETTKQEESYIADDLIVMETTRL